MIYRLCINLQLDDGPPKALERWEADFVDPDVARLCALHALEQKLQAGYPADRLLLGFAAVGEEASR